MSDSVLLLGRDYADLGPLAIAALPRAGAVALSRGAWPKAYHHVDANEDAALVARHGHARLVAVSDGYNGARASEIAIVEVAARARTLMEADTGGFLAEVGNLAIAVAEQCAGSKSLTCLVLAAVSDDCCRWASFGDSTLFVSDTEGPVSALNDIVLGASTSIAGVDTKVWSGERTLRAGERVAAVTDGITNFLPNPDLIPRELAAPADDAAVARGLAEGAMRGGAGDNVAVATARVPEGATR